MFIAPRRSRKLPAPEERNVFSAETFEKPLSLLWSKRNTLKSVGTINISPLWSEDADASLHEFKYIFLLELNLELAQKR